MSPGPFLIVLCINIAVRRLRYIFNHSRSALRCLFLHSYHEKELENTIIVFALLQEGLKRGSAQRNQVQPLPA